ncbi:GGDEF domain-containing protein [Wenzhouxiangella sediminis]|uniref:GGDEF domain-containing protein n=1 Tax=Wenzhouxiangella sediminis TaxID=1792836 RepID=UPI0011C06C49|nr:GGDEF domain-containing protein [Wenzhouxiangella sediminis]
MAPIKLFDVPHDGTDCANDVSLLVTRATTCAAAALAMLVLPLYQLIEIFEHQTPSDLLWLHAAWRAPVFLVALASLLVCMLQPGSGAPKLLLRLIAASVMIMMFGLFTTNMLHAQGNPEPMARGIIMATFAVSLLSLRGGWEVLLHFALPLAGSLAWLAFRGADLLETTTQLVDPVMMLVIAMIASELFYRIRGQQFALQRQLRQLASTDALTGLHNRRDLERRIAAEMSRSRRHAQPLSVVIGDLDHFKRVNDEYGHGVGDDVLRAVGVRMRRNLRSEDLAVRWGGEEFLLLLPDTDRDGAVDVAEKIRRTISEHPIGCNGQEVPVTISFGVAELTDSDQVADLIRRADDAMYRAKAQGRDRVCA